MKLGTTILASVLLAPAFASAGPREVVVEARSTREPLVGHEVMLDVSLPVGIADAVAPTLRWSGSDIVREDDLVGGCSSGGGTTLAFGLGLLIASLIRRRR